MKRLIMTTEAAEILGCSRQHLHQHFLAQGWLTPSHVVGRYSLFDPSDVRAAKKQWDRELRRRDEERDRKREEKKYGTRG